MEHSNPYETSNYITYTSSKEMYTDYHEWSTCDMYGCTLSTSPAERLALVDFYYATQGEWWRINENWLIKDPCINNWYGITCNTKGQIIAIFLFENHLDGLLPDSFGNLIYLKHLTLANDGREHETVPSMQRNTIYLWNERVFNRLKNLEEINLQHLGMKGKLINSLLSNHKLKYLNIAYNMLQGPL